MIHLIQCLCPDRHAIMAIGYDPETLSPDDAMHGFKAFMQQMFDKHEVNPWCAICGSSLLVYEDRATPFKTIEEAMPVLAQLQIEQAITNAALGKY
jgi:hypothetical protein